MPIPTLENVTTEPDALRDALNDFITPEEVSQITRLPEGTLAQMRYKGRGGLRFYKPSPRKVLYRRSEVLAWLEASAHTRTDECASGDV